MMKKRFFLIVMNVFSITHFSLIMSTKNNVNHDKHNDKHDKYEKHCNSHERRYEKHCNSHERRHDRREKWCEDLKCYLERCIKKQSKKLECILRELKKCCEKEDDSSSSDKKDESPSCDKKDSCHVSNCHDDVSCGKHNTSHNCCCDKKDSCCDKKDSCCDKQDSCCDKQDNCCDKQNSCYDYWCGKQDNCCDIVYNECYCNNSICHDHKSNEHRALNEYDLHCC